MMGYMILAKMNFSQAARPLGMRAWVPLLLALGLALGQPALAADTRKLPPLSTRTNLTYAADIRPIFEKTCFYCHGPQRQKRQLRLDTLPAVLKGSEDGPILTPGKTDQGDLILEISGIGDHDMPPWPSPPPILSHEKAANDPPAISQDGIPVPKPLTAEEIGLIRAWVAQGAK